jgi:predicted DNA-binding transcriptional regulator AlpA
LTKLGFAKPAFVAEITRRNPPKGAPVKEQLLSTTAEPVIDLPPVKSAVEPALPSTTSEPLLTVKEVAAYLGITEVGVYLGISGGRIPPPFYPLSRSPRWRKAEIDAALEATRQMPAAARAERRQTRIARQHAEKLAVTP